MTPSISGREGAGKLTSIVAMERHSATSLTRSPLLLREPSLLPEYEPKITEEAGKMHDWPGTRLLTRIHIERTASGDR